MAAISQLCSRDSVAVDADNFGTKPVGISGKALPSPQSPISSSLLWWRVPDFTLSIEAEDFVKSCVKSLVWENSGDTWNPVSAC